jgi:hypothetical protein
MRQIRSAFVSIRPARLDLASVLAEHRAGRKRVGGGHRLLSFGPETGFGISYCRPVSAGECTDLLVRHRHIIALAGSGGFPDWMPA